MSSGLMGIGISLKMRTKYIFRRHAALKLTIKRQLLSVQLISLLLYIYVNITAIKIFKRAITFWHD